MNHRSAVLLQRFARAARSHSDAIEVMDEVKARRYAAIISQLRSTLLAAGDGVDGLIRLCADPEPVVAGMAAVCLLDRCPEQALAVLRSIAGQPGLLGFRASAAIERWERGDWLPP